MQSDARRSSPRSAGLPAPRWPALLHAVGPSQGRQSSLSARRAVRPMSTASAMAPTSQVVKPASTAATSIPMMFMVGSYRSAVNPG